MVSVLELQECLRDSPKFRVTLEEQETQIELLEQKLEKVVKMCGVMVDTGKTYVAQQSLFANTLWDLSSCFRADHPQEATSQLSRMIHALQEMNKYHTMLLDQASRTVLKSLTTFLKQDIKGAREARHYFEKISGDLDVALSRHSQASKSRPIEIEETNNLLSATRTCFRHTALDYVHCVSMIQARKKQEVLGTLLSYMHACSTYFHQGYDLSEGLQPFLQMLGDEIVSMRAESSRLEKSLGDRHKLVTSQDTAPTLGADNGSATRMEGYLFKRTTNAFKTWNRRWFCLNNNRFVYRKRTGEDGVTVMEEDLRICSVKPVLEAERRFCFEVLSPSKSHMLQADSEEMYQAWITALQQGIGAAIQQSLSCASQRIKDREDAKVKRTEVGSENNYQQHANKSKKRMWEQLLKIPGNDHCCDCASPDPRWASINLGITLCIDCSGVHRSLGVHYSKVRSLTLDAWEPEILKVMAELGNDTVNAVYQENATACALERPSSKCSGTVREAWIKAKWVERRFVRSLSASPGTERATRNPAARKWSVRKLRRRPRSRDTLSGKQKLCRVSEVKTEMEGEEEAERSEVIMVGESLRQPPLEQDSIVISSEEDSTGGEEDDSSAAVGEEDMSELSPELLLYKASAVHNVPVMCHALALGADKQWTNMTDRARTCLHQAVLSGSAMACEFLLLNGVKINAQDAEGKTPLFLATELGHTAQVCLLLKHRADQHIVDDSGSEPLSIAIREANADIVTLLRLSRLNEEMKESDSGTGGDDTFNDVVRDFSQLAYNTPQKLKQQWTTSGE